MEQCTVNTQELKETIGFVLPGTKKNSAVEEMKGIVLDDQFALSYNDKVAYSYPIPDLSLNCAVVAEDFKEAVKGVRTKDTTLTILVQEGESDRLKVSGGKFSIELPILDAEKILSLHESLNMGTLEFIDIPEDFAHGLHMVEPIVSGNMDQPTGIFAIKICDKGVYGTDGLRAAKYSWDAEIPTVYIRKSLIPEIINFNPLSMSVNGSWVYFLNNDEAIMACKFEEENPKFPQMLDKMLELPKGDTFKFPNEMLPELDAACFFTDGEKDSEKIVSVTIEEDGIITITSSSSKGSLETSGEITDYSGGELVFSTSAVFLKGIFAEEGDMIKGERFLYFSTDTFTQFIVCE